MPLTFKQFKALRDKGVSTQQIVSFEAGNVPTRTVPQAVEKKEPGFFGRVRAQQTQAAQGIVEGIQEGSRLISEGHREAQGADAVGQAKGAFKSILGAGRAGLRTASGVASVAFAPITEAPGIRQTLDFIGDQVVKIPGVQGLVENASELAEKHPESAKDIKNIVDIAALLVGVKAKKPTKTTFGTKVQKAGDILEESGKKSFLTKQKDFIRELVRPSQTKKVKELQVPRTTETGRGIFKKSIIEPPQLFR